MVNIIYWICCKEVLVKVGLSPFEKISVVYFIESLLKMMKNDFCFILKALFILKIFKFLSWLFRSFRKNDLIRKVILISKFITSQPGWQTIAIHILHNISQVKATRQWNLVNYKTSIRGIFFFKNYAENEVGRLVPDLFLFFKYASYEVKTSGLQLSFNIFR